MSIQIDVSEWQQRVLQAPEECSLFLGGGRGGGKSTALVLLVLQHVFKYRSKAKIWILRREWKDLSAVENMLLLLMGQFFGAEARTWYNKTDHVWRIPPLDNAIIELGQCKDMGDFLKLQGREATLISIDEFGQWDSPHLWGLVRSCLRGPAEVQKRYILTANPGGAAHGYIRRKFVRPLTETGDYPVFRDETGRLWMYIPSTIASNPFLGAEYVTELQALAETDPELSRAYISGSWDIKAGNYFAAVWDEDRCIVPRWAHAPADGWWYYLAYDHGTSAPCYAALMAKALENTRMGNGQYAPKETVVLVDEFASVAPGADLNIGMGYSVSTIAEHIHVLCDKWNIKPRGFGDSAMFSDDGTAPISDEFKRAGIYLRPCKKGRRVEGWNVMRRMLADASTEEARDKPGFYVTRACGYWLNTVPILQHDPHNREDLDTRGADHAADATRYGLLSRRVQTTVEYNVF